MRGSTIRAPRLPKSAAAPLPTTVACTERNPGLRSTTLRSLVRDALRLLGRPRASISLVLTGDALIRELNRDYLETDRPTDVLAFPLADPETLADQGCAVFLGEIYVSLDTAREGAEASRIPLRREVSRLVIHGLLHLLGHDHDTPAAARRMRSLERRLLRALSGRIAATGGRRA